MMILNLVGNFTKTSPPLIFLSVEVMECAEETRKIKALPGKGF
jgi:hypothetical protein